MAHADFVHLRVHTAYSLAEGAIHIKDLANQCQGLGLPAVAMTDTNNLFGALEFSQTCAKAGVQPIVGCQLAVAFEASNPNRLQRDAFDRLVLLAQNEAGYRNLLSLTSRAFLAVEAGAANAHLLDGRVPHVLLLELFTDAGIGTMITMSEPNPPVRQETTP